MIDILMLEGVQLAQKAGVEWVEAVPKAPEFAKQFNLATKVNKWCGRGIHPRWIDSEGNEYAWSELGFATHLLD